MGVAIRIILLTMAMVLAVPGVSGSHGEAQWIQDGNYKNAAGELCCGERDCVALNDKDVAATQAGYYIKSLNEMVPYHEAQPSPDGHYWRCQWGGQRKCFFAPPGQS